MVTFISFSSNIIISFAVPVQKSQVVKMMSSLHWNVSLATVNLNCNINHPNDVFKMVRNELASSGLMC